MLKRETMEALREETGTTEGLDGHVGRSTYDDEDLMSKGQDEIEGFDWKTSDLTAMG